MKLQPSLMFIYLFILLLIIPSITADLKSDTQALLEFSSAVPHTRKLNWNSNTPICTSWVGITCNSDHTRVSAIHLPGVGLFGPIPSNSIGKIDSLRILSLRSNFLNGSVPSDIFLIPSLQLLYLQNNKFSGTIPIPLSAELNLIDLSFNSFTGNVPPELKNLPRLTVLNLQHNSFYGSVPDLDLPRLKLLNLSFNKLNGSIPSSLTKFPISSFLGNSLLCGSPLPDCSPLSLPPSPSSLPSTLKNHKKKLSAGVIAAFVVGGISVILLLVLVFLFCCLKKKKRSSADVVKLKAASNAKSEDFGSGVQDAEKNKLVFFEGCSYNFDLEDLLRASAEVLGKGSFGTAYKAVMDESVVVVVKRLREIVVGKREFEQHMEVIGRVAQHSNVVSPRAFYYSKDEKLLVCDYFQTGSLSALLHSNRGTGRTPVYWETRLKISLETARGLAHIHSEGGAKFIHGNIKSSNILLTQDLNPCISDFGLTPLMNLIFSTSRGPGYYAPEVMETRKITQKSDVYSFGVLLLEMLTGKTPLKSSPHDDAVDLPRWVRSVVREEWTAEVFDTELLGYQSVEEEMVQMLQIGLACVARGPDVRPTMDEVVRMIEEIRQSEVDIRVSSEDNISKDSKMNTP